MDPVESQGPLTAEVRIVGEWLRERWGQRGKRDFEVEEEDHKSKSAYIL